MHVGAYTLLSTLIFTALGTVLAGLLSASLHLLGTNPKSALEMGVWTLPNAFVVDLFCINLLVVCIIWPLVGSTYLYCASVGWVAPSQPWAWLSRFSTSDTIRSLPIYTRVGGFSTLTLERMISKSVLLAFGGFTFLVMPTCAWITVSREFYLVSLSTTTIPLSCDQMFPTLINGNLATSADGQIFEALCWSYRSILLVSAAWGGCLAFVISVVGTALVVVQGRSHQE